MIVELSKMIFIRDNGRIAKLTKSEINNHLLFSASKVILGAFQFIGGARGNW
jgi:hypothetical protein